MSLGEEQIRAEFEKKCLALGYSIYREGNDYLAVDTGQLWIFWQAALSSLTYAKSVPDGWLVPHLIDVHGAKRTSLPKELHDEVHGTVVWSAEIFCDSQDKPVIDKNGVKHYPKALYTAPPLPTDYERVRVLENILNKLHDAVDFYNAVMSSDEDHAGTGAFKDAINWIKEAAVTADKEYQAITSMSSGEQG